MDLQVDVVAAFFFIGWPIYQLMVEGAWTSYDESFYEHLTTHSALFPRGAWRALFPVAWTVLWPANGVAAYLFWHAYSVGDDTTYLVGLIFYMVGFLASCGWTNLFFRLSLLWWRWWR